MAGYFKPYVRRWGYLRLGIVGVLFGGTFVVMAVTTEIRDSACSYDVQFSGVEPAGVGEPITADVRSKCGDFVSLVERPASSTQSLGSASVHLAGGHATVTVPARAGARRAVLYVGSTSFEHAIVFPGEPSPTKRVALLRTIGFAPYVIAVIVLGVLHLRKRRRRARDLSVHAIPSPGN